MMYNNKRSTTSTKHLDEQIPKRAHDFSKSQVDPKLKKVQKLALKPDHFKVSGDGVFYTIQGEGITMGKPSCFLRLHLCNLRCHWCDAWYAWNSNTEEFWTESQDWSVIKTKQVVERNWQCTNPKVQKRLVITGGEPLLQKDRIDKLIDIMPDWFFEVETNGTLMPTDKMLTICQFNCSPKLSNSKNPKQARINKEVLQVLNQVKTVFKFVVEEAKDLEEIEADFVRPFKLDIEKIVVMPQGVTSDEVSQNARKVVEKVKEKGYRLLGRLQCDIWGALRRV